MPKPTTATVFDALTKNSVEFLLRATELLATSPNLSVLQFATGVELLLKARLFHEHWSLIASSPASASWERLIRGELQTARASELCKRITCLTGDRTGKLEEAFKEVLNHRNRVLHFLPPEDKDAVVTEQLRTWHFLHTTIERGWSDIFQGHAAELGRVEAAFTSNRRYLGTKYEELRISLKRLVAAGRVLECLACEYKAAVLVNGDGSVSSARCHVCSTRATAIRFACSEWHWFDEGTSEYACSCGSTHEVDALVEELDATAGMRPKDALASGPGRYRCGECLDFEPRVVPIVDGFACLGCGAQFDGDQLSSCDWCSERWVGYDTKRTLFIGCELCDGHPGA